jgi:hypothetical protein
MVSSDERLPVGFDAEKVKLVPAQGPVIRGLTRSDQDPETRRPADKAGRCPGRAGEENCGSGDLPDTAVKLGNPALARANRAVAASFTETLREVVPSRLPARRRARLRGGSTIAV